MELNIIWFILIAILYTGYFILEGFDLGVGILLPFLGKDDTQRRVIINTIGPHWDGNEVWLITAGGATFAAFPNWYATLFSGFYMPFFLMLIALILRGVAFEFRSKDASPIWRSIWDWVIFGGSLVPALLWGVAFTNFVIGIPIDASSNYVGGFWNLLNPYALIGGVISLAGFTLLGALFLTLKTTGTLVESARKFALLLWLPLVLLLAAFSAVTYFSTDILSGLSYLPLYAALIGILVLLVIGWLVRAEKDGWSFGLSALTVALCTTAFFSSLFPRLLVSSLSTSWSLTIYNSASSPYTLRVMTIVAVIFVPIVLAYQAWTYWVFRKRVTGQPGTLEY
jgi:cytochrome bd ubiquinol oxidase subunit II